MTAMQQSFALQALITWHACSCLLIVDHGLARNHSKHGWCVGAHVILIHDGRVVPARLRPDVGVVLLILQEPTQANLRFCTRV